MSETSRFSCKFPVKFEVDTQSHTFHSSSVQEMLEWNVELN